MKKQNILKLTVFLGLLSFFVSISAQDILWTYHLTTDIDNTPGLFWEDKKGNIIFNIQNRKDFPKENRMSNYQEGYILRLTKDGDFDGTIYIENCKNRTSFMPFKNNFFTHGNNCLEGTDKSSYDFRLFNKQGKLIRIGKSLKNYNRKIHFGKKKTTLFSKKNGYYHYGDLFVGQLNKKMLIKYKKIPMNSLELDGLGMIFLDDGPVQIGKSQFVISTSYGERGKYLKQSIELLHGGFFLINKNKVSWKYAPQKNGYFVRELESFNKKIIILFSSKNSRKNYIKIFNNKGQIIKEFQVLANKGDIYDMKISDDDLVLLTSKELIYYTMDGRLTKSITLPKMESVKAFHFLNDKSILIAGTKNKKTFIVKLGIKNDEKGIPEKKNNIKYSIANPQVEEVNSVSVFPNPTSEILNIKFILDRQSTNNNKFLIEVLNSDGNHILKKTVHLEEIQLDVSKLPSGTYFYKVSFENSEYLTGQFVKI